jgi:phospholipid transport system transporter-binding protein
MSRSFSLALPAILTSEQAPALTRDLETLISTQVGEGQEAQLDASALTQFDSSALAVILACRRAALACGGSLRVTGLPERARVLSEVYGVSGLLAKP